MLLDPHEDIFDDDTWRDPTEDGMCAFVYLVTVIMLLFGVACVIVGVMEFVRPGFLGSENEPIPPPALKWVSCGAGGFFSIFSLWFLWKESKHWSLRQMTFERFVTGLALATVAVIVLFIYIATESPMAMMLLPHFGAVIVAGCVLTYGFGLAGAYFHRIFPHVERIENAFVVQKSIEQDFGAKDADMDVDEDPVRSRYVVLRNSRLGERRCRILTHLYEVLEPGYVGNVKIVNGVIKEFKVTRRG